VIAVVVGVIGDTASMGVVKAVAVMDQQ